MVKGVVVRQKNRRQVRTIFIGRNCFLSFVMFAMTIISLIVAFFVTGSFAKEFVTICNKYFVSSASTIIGAGKNDNFLLNAKKCMVSFFDISDTKDNISVVPVFYNVKTDINSNNIKPVSSIYIKEDYSAQITEKVVEKNSVSQNIKNETTYNIDVQALLSKTLDIELSHKEPEILIVHTHGSESYTQSDKYRYSDSDYGRCQDLRFNVVRVGDELEKELKKRGFKVVHDRTINDYPSYNNSYNKTLAIIESNMQKYPSVKCVFDIHRDAIVDENDNKIKFTAQINNEKVSQIMIVSGSDQLGLPNPHWEENLSLALKIQKSLDDKYPGLMRPVNLRKERFNMHMTYGSLIFEIGTHGNTLDEALASIKYLADGIEEVLK